MIRETLYTLKTIYRQDLRIDGFRFGGKKPTMCVIGALRGNEYQQIYVCSLLIQALQRLEARGLVNDEEGILIVPCVNQFSMNVGKRFWPLDNTDINRMFPGYDQGETTQRIAAGLFQAIKDYEYGVQFASFYLPGDFVPHVRIMNTGFQDAETARPFGLPYTVLREPKPIDTTTLNYNWQIWGTQAFSLYTAETDEIDDTSANAAVDAVLRFLYAKGLIRCTRHRGMITQIVKESSLVPVLSDAAGLYRRLVKPSDQVQRGDPLAELLDPYTGHIQSVLTAPVDGTIFFAAKAPTMMEHTVAFRLIPNDF